MDIMVLLLNRGKQVSLLKKITAKGNEYVRVLSQPRRSFVGPAPHLHTHAKSLQEDGDRLQVAVATDKGDHIRLVGESEGFRGNPSIRVLDGTANFESRFLDRALNLVRKVGVRAVVDRSHQLATVHLFQEPRPVDPPSRTAVARNFEVVGVAQDCQSLTRMLLDHWLPPG